MKAPKLIFIIFCLCLLSPLQAQQQPDADFFARHNIKDTASTQQAMLNNIYMLSFHPDPYSSENNVCTAFRLHKNWMLTAAHCFKDITNQNANLHVTVKVKENNPKISGQTDFVLGVNKVNSALMMFENAKVFFYKPGYQEDGSAGSHANDMALLYIANSSASGKKQFNDFLIKSGITPDVLASLSPEALQELKDTQDEVLNDDRAGFFAQKVYPNFRFFILSESDVIDNLAPAETAKKYSYTLYKYVGNRKMPIEDNIATPETLYAQGPQKGQNVLYFYPDPKGGAGSPLFYGNFIVSIASGQAGFTAGPLLTNEFRNFLSKTMGKDYRNGMSVKIDKPQRAPKNP